jgi:hypothetical protein
MQIDFSSSNCLVIQWSGDNPNSLAGTYRLIQLQYPCLPFSCASTFVLYVFNHHSYVPSETELERYTNMAVCFISHAAHQLRVKVVHASSTLPLEVWMRDRWPAAGPIEDILERLHLQSNSWGVFASAAVRLGTAGSESLSACQGRRSCGRRCQQIADVDQPVTWWWWY